MSSVYVRIIAAISLLVFSAWCGHSWTETKWSEKWAQRDADEAKARAAAVEAEAEKHNARIEQLEKVTDETKILLANEINAKRAADAAADRLQFALDNYLQRAKDSNRTATIERAAAGTDIVVLANVLRRADRRAGELAEVAGARYIAGLDCQRRYEVIQKESR